MNNEAPLSLEAAIGEYLRAKSPHLTESSVRAYRSALENLAEDYPDYDLTQFEPRSGTKLIQDFLDGRWSARATSTYNSKLSILQDFFRWHAAEGRLNADPAGVINRKKEGRADRIALERPSYTADERQRILRANPDVRDSVPLRLVIDLGIRKGALQSVRFGDFDRTSRRVSLFTRGGTVMVPIPDEEFWVDLERLRVVIGARDDHYLLPRQKTHKARPPKARELDQLQTDLEDALSRAVDLAAELSSTEAAIATTKLAEAAEFLRFARERAWAKVRVHPDKQRGEHGTHDWWYGCMQRAGLVAPGVVHGQPMQKARHTAGRRVLERTGNLKAVAGLLGLGVRTAGITYASDRTDQLEDAMSNVRRQLSIGADETTGGR